MPNPFDQGGTPQQPAQFEDKTGAEFMAELVGEGKKYATVEDAIRGLAHAQHHIGVLEHENTSYKDKLTKSATVEEILAKINGQQPAQGQEQEQTPPSPSSSLDESGVKALVEQLLAETQTKSVAAQNKDKVVTALRDKFGGKAGEVWDQAEKSLGVDLEQLAAQSPSAVFRMLGLDVNAGPSESASSMASQARPAPAGQRPPEGSKRLVDYLLEKGEISRDQAVQMKYKFSADPDTYYS